MKKIRLSRISALHYFRLVYRSVLLLAVFGIYLDYRLHGGEDVTQFLTGRPIILRVIWVVFTIEMILRLIPSGFESPGSQKQFEENYIKTGRTDIRIPDNHAAVLVVLVWIGLNGIFGILHQLEILDDGIMILLACAYSVCDMICILFFCPFQTWFLKNKCCSSCRIYNWDYAMMFTPLFFVRNPYALSLLILSFLLLIRWEITIWLHPERFSENTNEYLHCEHCTEKLCAHKRQLKRLWRQIATATEEQLQKLKK